MYKHIIVAVDTSAVSEMLLREAIKVARNQESTIIIIHILDMSFISEGGMWVGLEAYLKNMNEAGIALLSHSTKKIESAGIKVESHLIEMTKSTDNIAGEIVATVKKLHGDLLVLGTHGRRGFRRFLLGSVAEEVIRSATTPVLLIRGDEAEP